MVWNWCRPRRALFGDQDRRLGRPGAHCRSLDPLAFLGVPVSQADDNVNSRGRRLTSLHFANILRWMNVISRPAIVAASKRHPEDRKWLDAWWKLAKSRQWKNLHEVRLVYPAADQVGGCLVFNGPHGRRLIVGVIWADENRNGTLFVKHYLTHADHDKGLWKKDCM